MLSIPFVHGRQHLCLLFLVGMLLHLTTSLAFGSTLSANRCFRNEQKAPHNAQPECKNSYFNRYPYDCCNWPEISCNNVTGRVEGLDLFMFWDECLVHEVLSLLALEDLLYLQLDVGRLSFTGGIPSLIGALPKLKHLFLCSYDDLGFVFPPQLGNLTSLEILEVCPDNSLSAGKLSMLSRLTSLKRLVLPNVAIEQATDWLHVVSNLPRLEHLDLSYCYLPPVVPHSRYSFNSSKSLVFLDLSFNNLDASSSWPWIFNHSSLISLSMSNNQLSGSIPNRFRRMTSLTHLDLSHNRLVGQLPSSLLGLCGLRSLDVSQNHQLQGDLSTIFSSLSCAKESLMLLSLHRNSFSGSLPDFTTFPLLRKLSLHSNKLNGSLPSYLKKPSNLAIFDAHNNRLTGSVPDLSALGYLKVLQLQNNNLSGIVHPGLGQLSRLRHLDVSSNSLEGDLGITHLVNLSSLRYLDISFNSLSLNVGSSWVPPFRLEVIGLASCGLGSQFPEWLRTQRNYLKLDMSKSGISDTVPYWFWNLSSVASFISLSHNGLHCKLPTDLSFEFWENPAIDLSFNFLEGSVPLFLRNAAYLNLSRNSFSGSVSFLCQSSYPLGIDLSHNNFSGKLPDCWSNFVGMSVLDLSNNSFSGQLPSSLGNLTGLQSLHLRNNQFSGQLPLSLCKLTELFYLDLGNNLFSGEIPKCLGHMLNNLTVLSLRNNSVSGSIPPQLCHPSIQILDLSMNNISGTIPECLCNLQAMTQKKNRPVVVYDSNGTFSTIAAPYKDYISLVLKGYLYVDNNHLELVKSMDLSSNHLGGKIHDDISCLTGLVFLNLSRNDLTGSITSKIGSLKSLESLDLSNNHLSGEIPPTLSELNFLGTLSLANNKMSGTIPTGTQIQGFSAAAFAGNPGLCGDPLPSCPGDEHGEAAGHNPKDPDNVFDLGLYISIALGVITGFWGVCGSLVLKRSWRYAYFRFWIHVYDRLCVLFTLQVACLKRRFLG